jgi:hypothetical protein
MIKSILKFSNTILILWGIFFYLIFGFLSPAIAQTNFKPLLGNYNSQPRINGHVDSDKLLKGLKNLGANTYMWLINGGNDWEDLKSFLPKAKKEGITLWAYLRPPTETPPYDTEAPYSEPYKNDYIAWSKAIAKLSLQNPNLIGYVIDDFWYNTPGFERGTIFSTNYIKQMVDAGKSINPKLKFYPLLYFRQINISFIDSLSALIDGVVAAYPGQIKDQSTTNDSLAIVNALSFTNDQYRVILVSLPKSVYSPKGDFGFANKYIKVTDPANAVINFSHYSDRALNFGHFPFGYHKIQIRIDNKIVWNYDVVDSNGTSIINLTKALAGKNTCKLSIGLYNNLGVSNYYTDTKLQVVSMKGIEYISPKWETSVFDKYKVTVLEGNNKNHLPLIVMPVGNISQYLKRYTDMPTTNNIAKRIETVTNFLNEGQIAGIVTYVLDMDEKSEVFKEVRKIFRSKQVNKN